MHIDCVRANLSVNGRIAINTRAHSTWNVANRQPWAIETITRATLARPGEHSTPKAGRSVLATTKLVAATTRIANINMFALYQGAEPITPNISMIVLHGVFVANSPLPNCAPPVFQSRCIRDCFDVWQDELMHDDNADFILSGIKEGFRITDINSKFVPAEHANYKSALDTYRDLVEDQIYKEIELGRYIITHEKPTIVSSLGAVPKSI